MSLCDNGKSKTSVVCFLSLRVSTTLQQSFRVPTHPFYPEFETRSLSRGLVDAEAEDTPLPIPELDSKSGVLSLGAVI